MLLNPKHVHLQAKDISELVGKAFKAAFTKQTLKRNRKKELPFPQEASAGISSHPWTVVKHEPEAGGIQPLRTDTERAGPSKNVHRYMYILYGICTDIVGEPS